MNGHVIVVQNQNNLGPINKHFRSEDIDDFMSYVPIHLLQLVNFIFTTIEPILYIQYAILLFSCIEKCHYFTKFTKRSSLLHHSFTTVSNVPYTDQRQTGARGQSPVPFSSPVQFVFSPRLWWHNSSSLATWPRLLSFPFRSRQAPGLIHLVLLSSNLIKTHF